MKNIKYSILFLSVLLITFSCDDALNLSPITEKEAAKFYSNENEIENAIYGVYAQLQHYSLYNVELIIAGELQSDITFCEDPNNDGGIYGELDSFNVTPASKVPSNIWLQSYVGIQRANVVLNRISKINFKKANIKQHRIGEMGFIRALLYFNLVRLFGDVPLVTEETKDPADFFGQGRTEKNKVYTQIITDLKLAIEKLPIKNESGRASKGAAQALLGEVYLTQGNFSKAEETLALVVNSGTYKLATDITKIFGIANEGNSETVFAVQFASGLSGGSEGSAAASKFSPSGTGVVDADGFNIPTQSFYKMYNTNDLRKKIYLGITNDGKAFTKKWTVNPTNQNDGGSDFMVIRYSNVILMYAEALNENGKINQAKKYLEMIRSRANLTTKASTQNELKKAIDIERQLELIGEGYRWFDLKRYGNAVEVMNKWFAKNNSSIRIDKHNLLLPIPQNQIDADPSIVQNPGY